MQHRVSFSSKPPATINKCTTSTPKQCVLQSYKLNENNSLTQAEFDAQFVKKLIEAKPGTGHHSLWKAFRNAFQITAKNGIPSKSRLFSTKILKASQKSVPSASRWSVDDVLAVGMLPEVWEVNTFPLILDTNAQDLANSLLLPPTKSILESLNSSFNQQVSSETGRDFMTQLRNIDRSHLTEHILLYNLLCTIGYFAKSSVTTNQEAHVNSMAFILLTSLGFSNAAHHVNLVPEYKLALDFGSLTLSAIADSAILKGNMDYGTPELIALQVEDKPVHKDPLRAGPQQLAEALAGAARNYRDKNLYMRGTANAQEDETMLLIRFFGHYVSLLVASFPLKYLDAVVDGNQQDPGIPKPTFVAWPPTKTADKPPGWNLYRSDDRKELFTHLALVSASLAADKRLQVIPLPSDAKLVSFKTQAKKKSLV